MFYYDLCKTLAYISEFDFIIITNAFKDFCMTISFMKNDKHSKIKKGPSNNLNEFLLKALISLLIHFLHEKSLMLFCLRIMKLN